jgi:amino acid adenylation domain-containing protein
MTDSNFEGIAIIGMAGRFPGAASVTEFWKNLVQGVESITTFSDAELTASGIDVDAMKKLPGYVAARGIIKDVEWFDANFFSMNPKEAEITDPQQRLFLEASWEALESAGYVPESVRGAIGVFAGMSSNTYYLNNVQFRPDLVNLVGRMAVMMANEKDYLTTHVAYKLNLKGPAVSVNTACSTSLVAVCQACQSLLNFQCDLALAGGVSLTCPQKQAYHHQEGGIISPDGHCRAFDASAQGTVSSDGLGIVVLKRLHEAVNDGDQIYAVIKGVAINNDGASKGSFTAPSVDGQAEVILQAQALAGFGPETISYVEAHGTGTPLGDPIEVAGLTQAFRAGTAEKNYCAIGSVKSNIGHLDTAAGVAGLIKTALALKHKQLPASLFYSQPNPRIDFENSPFFVNSQLREWQSGPTPRRAGVSSFGLGGTNAHVVLEEAPNLRPSGASREWQLLTLSARTESALDQATRNLTNHLRSNPNLNLADAAFTLNTGRSVFNHRRMLVCQSVEDTLQVIEQPDTMRIYTNCEVLRDAPVVFMFPGQGTQCVNMGVNLYQTEPVFRDEVDYCSKILQSNLSLDLRLVLFPETEQRSTAADLLSQTQLTQPALFVIEYALAKLWMSWGIKPKAMIGHSIGEYVAACLAGVMTLDEALLVIATRARLIQSQPAGGMLAIRLSERELLPHLGEELSIAAINLPSSCVVSGTYEAIGMLQLKLKEQGIVSRRLDTSHAFHSFMMDPVLVPFEEVLAKIKLKEPAIPFVSNVTGKWITSAEATDPGYWGRHLRQTVRFAEGLNQLSQDSQSILLEVGPGQTLSNLARQHPGRSTKQSVVSSLAVSKDDPKDLPAMLNALGKLWLSGAAVDWKGFYQREKRHRLALPTYPFERRRFWVEPGPSISRAQTDGIISPRDANHRFEALQSEEGAIAATAGKLTDMVESGTTFKCGGEARRHRFLETLKVQLQEFSGRSVDELPSSATFLDLGLDSLLLGQVSQFIQRQFGIQIGFRQLMENVSSLNALADYLDKEVPLTVTAQTADEPTPPGNPMPLETPVSAQWSATLSMIRDQLKELTAEVQSLRLSLSSAQPGRNEEPTSKLSSPDGKEETNAALVFGENAGFEIIESGRRTVQGTKEDVSNETPAPPHQQSQPSENKQSTDNVIIPLTQAQLELWFATLLGTDASRAFHQRFLVHLRGPLHKEFLIESLNEVVERHDSLRATFMPDGSGQRIASSLRLNLPVTDLSGTAHQEEELARRINPEQEPAFDLVKGPLVRAELFKFSDTHHGLLLVAHHIIMDGWSMGVVLHELSAKYSARCRNESFSLPPAMQFSEYVQWQNSSEYRKKFEKAEKHWLEQFTRLPTPVELPSDRPRPAKKTYRTVTRQVRLEPTLHRSLKKACQRQGCTFFNYLLGSFAVWVTRFTGQSDLVIGIHASGQVDAGGQYQSNGRALVGHCVNLLPLRSYCDAARTFSDYLQSLKNVILDAYENQHFTFGSLVNKLNLPRDASHVAPLISMTFNLVRAAHRIHFHELESEIVSLPKASCIFDLTFDLFDSDDDLVIECRFNNDLFDPETIVRWLGHWRTLLQGLAADPAASISSFPLLGAVERERILKDWNATTVNYPSDRCVHQLFEEQAGISPHATAVVFEDQQLTYCELNHKANQLARHLKQLGVGSETLVAVCVERSLEMVIGLLAISKAGGAYVPLDPSYPHERIEIIIADAQAAVILTQRHLLDNLFTTEIKNGNPIILCLDAEDETWESGVADNLPTEVRPENLAYVLFTSGSTGRPKGVQITHQALVNFLSSMQQEPGITSSDVLLAVTTLSFDIAGLELWLPLITGARVVIARRETAMDGKQLARQLEECKATIMQATPITWRMLVYVGWTGNPNLKILCGGESWGVDLVSELLPRCKSLWNMYGPTETTIWSAATKVECPELPHIGRPIANTQFHVLDGSLQPVPIGVPGELHIGGHGLARGYLNRAALTQEKFIPNPFNDEPGARLYKTGDLVRYRLDGRIEFLGRIDNQVKIRGYRIELGEIEAALRKHASVADVAVTARELSPGNKSLAAYVVLQKPAPNSEELKNFLGSRLPDYMVPAVFVTLESLPLTPNGKVDRKALPDPELQSSSKEIIPPRTSTEAELAKIWCEVLHHKEISINDSFFELGGNSLAATQLISRLRGFHRVEIELRDIFDYPTVATMAELVDRSANKQMEVNIPKLVPLKRRTLNTASEAV